MYVVGVLQFELSFETKPNLLEKTTLRKILITLDEKNYYSKYLLISYSLNLGLRLKTSESGQKSNKTFIKRKSQSKSLRGKQT